MFSQIIGAIGQKKGTLQSEDIDEEGGSRPPDASGSSQLTTLDAVKKHKKQYDDDDDADEDSLGAAAALQALKMFNKGETGEKQSKGAFLGLAMSEASKVSKILTWLSRVTDRFSFSTTRHPRERFLHLPARKVSSRRPARWP